jgi:very-short-patch-repair endonuclease
MIDYKYILDQYSKEQRSIASIAEELGTYPNKILRALHKLGIQRRSKSEAQQLALETGRAAHPTKGHERPADVKQKISESVYKNWKDLSDDERSNRSESAKRNWQSMSDEQHKEMSRLGNKALKESAKMGSKMERHLINELRSAGYELQFHKRDLLTNENFEIDIFLQHDGIVIEIDGPTHHRKVFSNREHDDVEWRDRQKNGLIILAGYIVIRVLIDGAATQIYKRQVWSSLSKAINEAKTNKMPRVITLDMREK